VSVAFRYFGGNCYMASKPRPNLYGPSLGRLEGKSHTVAMGLDTVWRLPGALRDT
jgi:hypothetical protein